MTPESVPGLDDASRSRQKRGMVTNTAEEKLAALGLSLPAAPAPVANYVPALQSGHLLFVSGQISKAVTGEVITGKLGGGVDVARGREAARACALNILAQAKAALGSLERIERIVKLTGFVASTPAFTDQPQVVNGCSDLLVEVLGERGRHTRSAVGVAALPLDAAVEVEAIIAVKPA
jgi:enamine deaminase RidA (YjgF/YER057c/UK114 family)